MNFVNARLEKALRSRTKIEGNSPVSASSLHSLKGTVDISQQGIRDLRGIEALINVKRLDCSGNPLKEDVHFNALPKLEELLCADTSATRITISELPNLSQAEIHSNIGLTNLILQGLPKLRILLCGRCSLSTLDLQPLAGLEVLNCARNRIALLQMHGLKRLKFVDCSNNELKELDLTHAEKLVSLRCSGNQLTSLNLSQAPLLKALYCSYNPKLTKIQFGKGRKLAYIDIRYTGIRDLSFLAQFPELRSVEISGDGIKDLSPLLANEEFSSKGWLYFTSPTSFKEGSKAIPLRIRQQLGNLSARGAVVEVVFPDEP